MKIGYPCLHLGMSCRPSRTFRLRSYSKELLKKTVGGNLNCLKQILEFNVQHGIMFFRITSDLVPFASHPVNTFDWQKEFSREFAAIGRFITDHDMRISMHPDQFVLLNAKEEKIVRSSLAELRYQARVLDLMNLDGSAKLQIHIGGVYGDKPASIARFIDQYQQLPDQIKRRLVIENDERLYDVRDCLDIARATGVPVLFDWFHWQLNNRGENPEDLLAEVFATWKRTDGIPMMDYSSQEPNSRKGAHAQSLDRPDFQQFLQKTKGLEFDLMLEIKDKEKSVLLALQELLA